MASPVMNESESIANGESKPHNFRRFPQYVERLKPHLYGRFCTPHLLVSFDRLKRRWVREGYPQLPPRLNYIEVNDPSNITTLAAFSVIKLDETGQSGKLVQIMVSHRDIPMLVNFFHFVRKNLPMECLYHKQCVKCHPTPVHYATRYRACKQAGAVFQAPAAMSCVPKNVAMTHMRIIELVAGHLDYYGIGIGKAEAGILFEKLSSGNLLNYQKVLNFVRHVLREPDITEVEDEISFWGRPVDNADAQLADAQLADAQLADAQLAEKADAQLANVPASEEK